VSPTPTHTGKWILIHFMCKGKVILCLQVWTKIEPAIFSWLSPLQGAPSRNPRPFALSLQQFVPPLGPEYCARASGFHSLGVPTEFEPEKKEKKRSEDPVGRITLAIAVKTAGREDLPGAIRAGHLVEVADAKSDSFEIQINKEGKEITAAALTNALSIQEGNTPLGLRNS
jgi:hypothetical protein